MLLFYFNFKKETKFPIMIVVHLKHFCKVWIIPLIPIILYIMSHCNAIKDLLMTYCVHMGFKNNYAIKLCRLTATNNGSINKVNL